MTTTTPSAKWNAESVRLTLFTVAALQSAELVALWRRIAGIEPQQTRSKVATATHQVQGPYRQGVLIVGGQPGRVDVIHAAIPQPMAPEPPGLGPFEAQLENLVSSTAFLQAEGPAARRAAMGCVLLQPTPNRIDGYRVLAPFLPDVKIDPEKCTDFAYQINRPRPSAAVTSLAINRISKWSVQMTAMVMFNPAAGTSLQQLVRFAARLETDMNTERRDEQLPTGGLKALIDELKALTIELATKGDVP
jgi:hypothetical protein